MRAIQNVRNSFDLGEKIIDFFRDYSFLLYEAKYKLIWKGSQNINSLTNPSKITNSTCTSKIR